ncbi:LLM class flavin-dependent oxidoreductase [Novosphingobium aquae]|uniref:LLM class flavin-dependent oxidoreductase n=1 Tax=Novosphingobium aquae TaxID=3133435 RepID=A0ABU8S760_9SPHN
MNDPAYAGDVLERAEAAGLDLLVLGREGALPFDPLVIAAWAAPRVRTMGIVACVPAKLSHPFHVARALSAIDFLSAGLSGWAPVAAGAPAGMAEDMVLAARALWDGWGTDTLIIDKASGRYLDSSKVMVPNYKGPFFEVAGPVNAMRPPQGHPLLVRLPGAIPGIPDVDLDLELSASHIDLVDPLAELSAMADGPPRGEFTGLRSSLGLAEVAA